MAGGRRLLRMYQAFKVSVRGQNHLLSFRGRMLVPSSSIQRRPHFQPCRDRLPPRAIYHSLYRSICW